jgi:hypothetical protein
VNLASLLFEGYGPTAPPVDTAATGVPQTFTDPFFVGQLILVLLVFAAVALWFGRKRESRIDQEMEWNAKWGDLARYNTERSKGIVHTPEYDAEMAANQEAFNAEQLERWKQGGNTLVPPLWFGRRKV